MALRGKIEINSKTYDVVECAYDFHQSIDETGKPVSRPQGGTITFVIPATSDEDVFFYRWMFNKTEVHDGTFVFTVFVSDGKESYKTLEFTNAYCIAVKDYFNDNDSKLMYTTVTISAQTITIGSNSLAEFSNEWT